MESRKCGSASSREGRGGRAPGRGTAAICRSAGGAPPAAARASSLFSSCRLPALFYLLNPALLTRAPLKTLYYLCDSLQSASGVGDASSVMARPNDSIRFYLIYDKAFKHSDTDAAADSRR
ncbi:hypothetical protein EVAR_51520_1 [Eumeta japonica]|uniref:Uncharacterized protein n=1 Tax=Eumeta variegata TaxID=151549 RepID=A0A4C1XFC5_EUMVA|nr:hypothetical protein EVAR_51520_1 [Eumeta japonica]